MQEEQRKIWKEKDFTKEDYYLTGTNYSKTYYSLLLEVRKLQDRKYLKGKLTPKKIFYKSRNSHQKRLINQKSTEEKRIYHWSSLWQYLCDLKA